MGREVSQHSQEVPFMFCEFCGDGPDCSVCGRGCVGMVFPEPRNARFWVYELGGWVRLTLKPGQSVELTRHGGDTEGYWCESTRWRYDAEEGRIVREYATWGRDCDGRYESFSDAVCDLDKLRAVEQTCGETGQVYDAPEWESVQSGQRDYAAEAMGY